MEARLFGGPVGAASTGEAVGAMPAGENVAIMEYRRYFHILIYK